jgi:hypothetical protein
MLSVGGVLARMTDDDRSVEYEAIGLLRRRCHISRDGHVAAGAHEVARHQRRSTRARLIRRVVSRPDSGRVLRPPT